MTERLVARVHAGMHRSKAAAVLAACALSACAGPRPQSEAETRHAQLAQAHQRGTDAHQRGDDGRALRHYGTALDRARAMEDADAVAVNLLNIAALLHRTGDLAGARGRLEEIIAHAPPFPARYLGRAEARLALIELQLNRIEEAARRAGNAEQLCGTECPWRLALLNIKARIALRKGDPGSAEAGARQALAGATAAADAREEANAWRTLGEAAGATGRSEDARSAFAAALELDKRLGDPERIVLDLMALAQLEFALENRAAARAYARRAVEVAGGAGLAAPLEAARALLLRLE